MALRRHALHPGKDTSDVSLYTRRYAEKGQAVWWINVQWKGYARIHVSAGTHQKRQAQALLSTVKQLKAAGRRDLWPHRIEAP